MDRSAAGTEFLRSTINRQLLLMKVRATIFRCFLLPVICILLFSFPMIATAQDAGGENNSSSWVSTFLGRLHPLAVHFPVALILFAALLELLSLRKFQSTLRPGISISLAIGMVSAIIAAILGLLLSNTGDYGGEILTIHQWTGIGTSLIGVIAYVLLKRTQRHPSRAAIKLYRGFLFIAALSVSVSGHFGASLTHGEDYLTSALPWTEGYDEQVEMANIDFVSNDSDSGSLSDDQQGALQVQVRSIFAHHCYKCHGPEKVKGDLRLDNKEMIFRGGESGPIFIPGNPDESEIYKRITLPKGHEDVMPQKGRLLSEKQISTIRFWIQQGAPWPNTDKEKVFRTAALEPRDPALPSSGASVHPIDKWVDEYFKKQEIKRPNVVDDRIYLRRIYLDIVGLLPSPEVLANFSKDPRPDKRAIYVRELLNRNDDYAIHWLTFWNDALRNDYTGTGYITDGRSAITDWLYKSLKSNKPYDQFITELISPTKESKGFIEGIRWRGVVNASQRTELQAAQNVAQVFLGLNLKCASCHNSFINNWKLEDAYAFANIFTDSALEINRCDKPTGKYTRPRMLWEKLGNISTEASSTIKQKELAALMTRQENGRVYRTIVNRVWAKLMGRGIVEPVDVMDNEPWHQDLLDWLAYRFANDYRYNLKELIYQIATSQTYQMPSVGYKDVNRMTSNEYVFKGMVRRRMSAEQFADAVGKVVAPVFPDSLMKYDPKSTNAFLQESSGPRASLVVNNVFLTALGRPNRETVITSRESEANLLQALELTNGEQFNAALKKGALRWMKQYPELRTMITAIYQHALARTPTSKEMNAAIKILGSGKNVEQVEDLLWTVMLLPEFQIIY
jgi:uncharacterized membrane protein/mono/diheme cytochrome c family protein